MNIRPLAIFLVGLQYGCGGTQSPQTGGGTAEEWKAEIIRGVEKIQAAMDAGSGDHQP